MALEDFVPERVQVTYKGKALAEVRGLSVVDVAALLRRHLPELQRMYTMIQTGETNFNDADDQTQFILKLLAEAPIVVCDMIALAADEPEQAQKVRLLPLPLQVKIVQDVFRLTFEDYGGPKAFVALLVKMIQGKELPAVKATTTIQ